MMRKFLLLLSMSCLLFAEQVGVRPYEMDWAGRHSDSWPAVVDYESDMAWSVETKNSVATFARSREQQLFGDYVAKLTYRYEGEGAAEITLRPEAEVPLKPPFDMIGCWMYGNNWGTRRDKTTPSVSIYVLFKVPDGNEIAVYLCNVNWKEWHLPLRRLTEEQVKAINVEGVAFSGFRISGGTNKGDRVLYFDNLSVHQEEFKPLTFEPRPERGIAMFPGQGTGANNGPGKLPFPTREETILPDSGVAGSVNEVVKDGDGYILRYRGSDGVLEYRYEGKTGRWDDISARWEGGAWFKPLSGGGAMLPPKPGSNVVHGMAPERATLLGVSQEGEALVAQWRYEADDARMETTYTLSMKGKTLILDTRSLGGLLGAVSYGCVRGLEQARVVRIPYYDYANGRPGVVVSGDASNPLFVSGHTCWYRSNSSRPWGRSEVDKDGLVYMNGGVEYIPKTDGKRNDCFERFFVTVGPKFEEHLPNIPNPKSPWKHITGTHQWRAHGAGNRDNDKAYWKRVWRDGMREVLVTDHETGWRDGGESFTFRTKAAPKKGGDQGMADYSRYMQDVLGFVYGPYNNFTDFAPVNEYWDTDMVGRRPDNQLQTAWMRCYGPKPQRAVEFCAKLSPINQEKYKFSTAYCDVHTSVTPWGRCDFDYRVPGAGTFAATYYAYGEIMLIQKATWNGPVYSEGPHHCFYSGLTDGNYAQDRSYHIPTQPWLVDFDLRKMHELECNFGMGNHDMFYGERSGFVVHEGVDFAVDRFLAATLAFGHPGFLVSDGGRRLRMRGYFMLQQLHSRYTQASVDTIGYVDEDGRIYNTSQALANKVFERSQLVIRYKDGTRLVVNGNWTQRMKVEFGGRKFDLPPNGYAGWTEDGAIDVFSGEQNGLRCDYAVTPTSIYLDSRDACFQRFPMAGSIGAGVARKISESEYEYIPIVDEAGWNLPVVKSIALDYDGNELGEATVRRSRGLSYVVPVENAYSYRLLLGTVPSEAGLTSIRPMVAPGETVVVKGASEHRVSIPADAKFGSRLWFEFENRWIDFTVQEIAGIQASVDGDKVVFDIFALRPDVMSVECSYEGISKTASLSSDGHARVEFDASQDGMEGMRQQKLELRSGAFLQSFPFGMIVVRRPLGYAFDHKKIASRGFCIRGQAEAEDFAGTGAAVHVDSMSCGGQSKTGVFMHPPYKLGVGYSFVEYEIQVPQDQSVVLRGYVGKRDGGFLGDGIWFSVQVYEADGKWKTVMEEHVGKFEWKPFEADLTPWKGQKKLVRLVSDVGPDDNSEADHACWGDLRLETKESFMVYELDCRNELYAQETPQDYAKLSVEQIRSAKRAWLCYQGQGFNSMPNSYESHAVINGVNIGLMTEAGGSETKNIWSEERRTELTPEAVKALGLYNKLEVINAANDYYKLRRLRIVLELPDGKLVSSKISTVTFTQPGSWRYAEGITFPMEAKPTIPIGF